MGRLGKVKTSEVVKNYAESIDKIGETTEALVRLVATEGLTIGMGIMLWRATAEIEITDAQGKKTPLGRRRKMFIDMLKRIDGLLSFNVPVVNFAPMEWLSDFFEIYIDDLDVKTPDGLKYAEVDLGVRLEMVILIPVLIRIVLKFVFKMVGEIGEIIPG